MASNKKSSDESNPQFQDLLTPKSAKPVAGGWATFSQIVAQLPFLAGAVDETFLRNRAREINPRTSAPWIPKPRNNHFEVNPTILGLLEWFAAKAGERAGLPAYFDNMKALENSYLPIPVEFQKWANKNGCGAEAQIGGSRINPRPYIKKLCEIAKQIATGRVTGIEGFDKLNKEQEIAENFKLQNDKLKDEALLRSGEMLLASDGSFALTKLAVDELLWEKLLQPARAAILKAPKEMNRQLKNILAGPETAEEKSRKCAVVVTATIAGLLDKLREKIPAAKTDGE